MLPARWINLAGLVAPVVSQTFHTVLVGDSGSFYNPPTVSAELDDVITFVFSGLVNSVTQSSFEQPCNALPGGFNSGLQGVVNGTSPPVWNLIVTNISEPIWYFCQATEPLSHCEAGMVGAINPPIDQFSTFMSVAKAVTATPTPTHNIVLSGIGAVAPSSPTLTTTLIQSSSLPSSATPSISTSSASPGSSLITAQVSTATAPSSKSNLTTKTSSNGPIIGGAVGGASLVVIIVFFVFLLCRRRRTAAIPYREGTSEWFDKSKLTSPAPSRSPRNDSAIPPAEQRPRDFNSKSRDRELHPQPSTGTFDIIPRHPYGPPSIINDLDYLDQPASSQPLLENVPAQYNDNRIEVPSVQHARVRGPEYNVQDIAKEVAALLKPETADPQRAPPILKEVHSPRPVRQLPDPNRYNMKSPGPPQYNARASGTF